MIESSNKKINLSLSETWKLLYGCYDSDSIYFQPRMNDAGPASVEIISTGASEPAINPSNESDHAGLASSSFFSVDSVREFEQKFIIGTDKCWPQSSTHLKVTLPRPGHQILHTERQVVASMKIDEIIILANYSNHVHGTDTFLFEGLINDTCVSFISGYLHANFRAQENTRTPDQAAYYYDKFNNTHIFGLVNKVRSRLRRFLDSEQLALLLKFGCGHKVNRERFKALLYVLEFLSVKMIHEESSINDRLPNEKWFKIPPKFTDFDSAVVCPRVIPNDEVIRIVGQATLGEQIAYMSITQLMKKKYPDWRERPRRNSGEPTDFWSQEPEPLDVPYM